MRLEDLRKKTRTVEVTFMGESAEVEYRAAAVTPEFIDALRGLDTLASMMKQLEMAVTHWDLRGEEGKEIPVTVEAMGANGVPVELLRVILRAIVADMHSGWDNAEKKD